jgi:hypothetical protein
VVQQDLGLLERSGMGSSSIPNRPYAKALETDYLPGVGDIAEGTWRALKLATGSGSTG